MRVAVYGGSFNPPHVGHAMVAAWLRWTDRVDSVWLLPVWKHPFGKPQAPWALRLAMAEALAEQVGQDVRVNPIEAELEGVSYTVRTLDVLAERHPEHRFHLVVGADVAPQTPLWKDWDRIRADYSPVLVGRAGFPEVPDAPTFPEVSSTDVRARIRDGRPWDHLVPSAVAALIRAAGPDVFRE